MRAFARRFPLVGRWKKKLAGRRVSVCMSLQALSPLESERLVGSGRANNHSMRRNGGKTLVTVSDRPVARGTCHVRSRKPLQKDVAQGAGQTNGKIRLKPPISIAKLSGQLSSGNQRWRPLGTCRSHVPSDFIDSLIAPEQRVRLGREGHRSTRTDGGKISSSILEGSWVRITTKPER